MKINQGCVEFETFDPRHTLLNIMAKFDKVCTTPPSYNGIKALSYLCWFIMPNISVEVDASWGELIGGGFLE